MLEVRREGGGKGELVQGKWFPGTKREGRERGELDKQTSDRSGTERPRAQPLCSRSVR